MATYLWKAAFPPAVWRAMIEYRISQHVNRGFLSDET